jgi:hypothetical protein
MSQDFAPNLPNKNLEKTVAPSCKSYIPRVYPYDFAAFAALRSALRESKNHHGVEKTVMLAHAWATRNDKRIEKCGRNSSRMQQLVYGSIVETESKQVDDVGMGMCVESKTHLFVAW